MGVPRRRFHVHSGWENWNQGSLCCWQLLSWHPCNIQHTWVFAYTWIWKEIWLSGLLAQFPEHLHQKLFVKEGLHTLIYYSDLFSGYTGFEPRACWGTQSSTLYAGLNRNSYFSPLAHARTCRGPVWSLIQIRFASGVSDCTIINLSTLTLSWCFNKIPITPLYTYFKCFYKILLP